MRSETENLLDGYTIEQTPQLRNPSSRRYPAVSNGFSEFNSSHKRRYRLFIALLCLSAVTYFSSIRILSNESNKTSIALRSSTPKEEFESVKKLQSTEADTNGLVSSHASSTPQTEIASTNLRTPTPTTRTPPIVFVTTHANPVDPSVTTTPSNRNYSPGTTPSVSEKTTFLKNQEALDATTATPVNYTTPQTTTQSTSVSIMAGAQASNRTTREELLSTAKSKSTNVINLVKEEPETKSKAPGCKLPILDPFDKSIKHLIKEDFPKPKCAKNYDLLYQMELNSTFTQLTNPEKLGWTQCCYKVLYRADSNSSDPDNEERFSKECHSIQQNATKVHVEHEYVTIFCKPTKAQKGKGKLKKKASLDQEMVDAFAYTPLKPSVEQRIEKFLNQSNTNPNSSVNLVVLGLDAVSHMNFQRIMPKVHSFLVKNLSALGMNGYTKIGDNTYPNIAAALTSWNDSEVNSRCSKSNFFDDCPFLWKNFSENGYRTSYGEDSPWMGAFNYLKKGFRKPPTDYYLRPLSRSAEEHIRNDLQGNAHICYGPRLSFDLLLNYMKSLASTMGHDKRYFQFIWATSLTHDYLNAGHLGEPNLLSFMQWFSEQGYLNNTVFVLMSDHGIRWGPIRDLHQGKVEESMPFIYYIFPDWFRKKYKTAITNLRNNRERLATPYDTYETFNDILFLQNIENDKLKFRAATLRRINSKNKIPRGISMFLPIPKTRTCKEAVIAEHWCICHKTKTLSTNSSEVHQAANYAVYELNALVAKFPKCAYLTLHSVEHAQLVLAENNQFGKMEKVIDLTFVTEPGKGYFDVTVVRNNNSEWKLSGRISRTNLYGNQSYCVDDKDMKKYCNCIL